LHRDREIRSLRVWSDRHGQAQGASAPCAPPDAKRAPSWQSELARQPYRPRCALTPAPSTKFANNFRANFLARLRASCARTKAPRIPRTRRRGTGRDMRTHADAGRGGRQHRARASSRPISETETTTRPGYAARLAGSKAARAIASISKASMQADRQRLGSD
jgi:hypothetical protein